MFGGGESCYFSRKNKVQWNITLKSFYINEAILTGRFWLLTLQFLGGHGATELGAFRLGSRTWGLISIDVLWHCVIPD